PGFGLCSLYACTTSSARSRNDWSTLDCSRSATATYAPTPTSPITSAVITPRPSASRQRRLIGSRLALHVDRRTQPTPRTVCTSRDAPPASVLVRRYPTYTSSERELVSKS